MHIIHSGFARTASSDAGNGAIRVRPETVGAVVGAIGTEGFAPAIGTLIGESVPIDYLHLERCRPRAGSASDHVVDWFGSWSACYEDVSNVMRAYYRDYWQDDPLSRPVRSQKGTLVLLRDVGAMAAGELRRRFFDEPRIAEECMLVHGDAKNQYALSMTRGRGRAAFAMDELYCLRRMAEMLFPMFESHVRACGAQRPALVDEPAREDGFEAQLERENIQLSQRERELCKLLLSRWSVPEAASHLDIKLSTAKTYVGRAFAKLGVSSRKELFAWAGGNA